jgi:hypothetical protein
MTRGIGWSVDTRRGVRTAGRTLTAMLAVYATIGTAQAADTPTNNRFGESEMMDAARHATTSTGTASRPVNIGVPPADELRVLEARREAELKRLSDKLRRAVEARGPRPAEPLKTPEWTTEVTVAPLSEPEQQQRSALGALPATGTTAEARDFGLKGRATVLMVMAPGDRRASNPERGADPILCVTSGCYVSNGAQASAAFLSFGQSLGITGRIGRGAGACNHSRACVFRDVDLGSGLAMLQPIDLKFVRHDAREQREVTIDGSCRLVDGRLSCARPVRTATYTLWIVPEHVAREVGPERLVEAVGDGLATAQTAELPWQRQ